MIPLATFLIANSNWAMTSLLALILTGVPAMFLGWLVGRFLWRGEERRTRMLETENRRLAKEATLLECACRDLETKVHP